MTPHVRPEYRDEFPLDPGLVHLNHAGVGPWPRRTAEAVKRFADENATQGSRRYPQWVAVEERVRERAATLLNAPSPVDIALVKNTSEALSIVAFGLPWEAGDNVVFGAQEFPSNRVVWQALAEWGVEARAVDLNGAPSPEDALLDATDERTRLLAVSAVQYASGMRADLDRLSRECRNRGVLLCVDAIQQLGVLPLDLGQTPVDFLMADGHKWLLAPEGLGIFYCRAELRETLRLNQYGWHMVEAMGDFDRKDWRPAAGARRFECGSPNMTLIHALDASLALFAEVGLETVARNVLINSTFLADYIDNSPDMELLSPVAAGRRAGIVTFALRGRPAAGLYQHLMDAGVLCANRGGGVRFSPHFYTSMEALEGALERVRAYAASA